MIIFPVCIQNNCKIWLPVICLQIRCYIFQNQWNWNIKWCNYNCLQCMFSFTDLYNISTVLNSSSSVDIRSQNTLFHLSLYSLVCLFSWDSTPCQGQDCGRNMAEAHPIHHKLNLPNEIQDELPQQWVLSCMLDPLLVYLSPELRHNGWFTGQSGW